MSRENLKRKAASGMIWTAIQKYSTMVLSFVSGIILARLLTPDDFGCIGMLAIFMSLAEVFIDAGFGSALIQKKNPTQADYSTVFYFNLVMSAALYLLLFFCAPLIANFYRMPILSRILRLQGLVLFIYAFSIIQRNIIRKNLRFRKLSTITIITSIISLVVTVFMAYMGYGVWSLVAQNFIVALIPCIFFWVTTDWRPTWEYSWISFKELFGFGSFMFFTHLFTTFSQRITGLLVGRWYDPATMGYYTKASDLQKSVSNSVSGVMVQTTYPLYASIQDDMVRLANMVKRITSTLAFITVPLLSLLIVIAKPLIIFLYSDKWLSSVPYFQVLCLAGMATCLFAVNNQTIAAIGKSKVTFNWTMVKQVINIVLQLVGIVFWGIWGLLVGKVLSAWISYFINISLVTKYVGYKTHQQVRDLLPIFIVSLIAVVVAYCGGMLFRCGMYITAFIQVLLFGAVYLAWSLFFKPESYTYSLSILHEFKSRISRDSNTVQKNNDSINTINDNNSF